jgi:hypothetical protein
MPETAITGIAATAFTVIGIGTFFHYFLHVMRWPRATGTVVGNIADRRSDSNRYAYFPRVAFTTPNGATYEVRGDIGLNEHWPIGQKVELRYRPSNPNHTTLAKGWQRFLFATLFIGLAVACWYAWLGAPRP